MIPQPSSEFDLHEELISLGMTLRKTYKTNQMLRRIHQKPFHTTWILEDNFDPSAESSKFTTTKPEIFYIANPSMSIPLYNKYVMGCERSKGVLNVLAFCSVFSKLQNGNVQLKWKGEDIEKIGIQKTMAKCSTINWNSAPSYSGGALSRWGDDHNILALQTKNGEIIYFDLMPEVNDIFTEESQANGYLTFGSNSLSHPSKYEIVQEDDNNREFISKHDPPLEVGTVNCDTSFKITEECFWSEQAIPFISSFTQEFKGILNEETRKSLLSLIKY